jgi:hypothetical protein
MIASFAGRFLLVDFANDAMVFAASDLAFFLSSSGVVVFTSAVVVLVAAFFFVFV